MRLILLLGVLVLATGCASTVGLDVAYPAAGVNRALLASVPARRVSIGPVTDQRRELSLGTDPESKKAIVTRRPVTDIVREALTLELEANGHVVAPDGADVALAATVDEFRLDVRRGYRNAQYIGRVVVTLAATDARTGQRLLERPYIGTTRREIESASESGAREAMDTALARAMHDLATDPALVNTLARAATATAR